MNSSLTQDEAPLLAYNGYMKRTQEGERRQRNEGGGCTMEFNELTEEQKTKARACETPEELVALAQSEGVELTDEQLEAVSGGKWGLSCNKDKSGPHHI